jgi:hypothetical protein
VVVALDASESTARAEVQVRLQVLRFGKPLRQKMAGLRFSDVERALYAET